MSENSKTGEERAHPFFATWKSNTGEIATYGFSSKIQKVEGDFPYVIQNYKHGQVVDSQKFRTYEFAELHIRFCHRLNDFLNKEYFKVGIIDSYANLLGSGSIGVSSTWSSGWVVSVDNQKGYSLGEDNSSLNSERLVNFIFYVLKLALLKKLSKAKNVLLSKLKTFWSGQKVTHNRSY